MAFSAQRRHGGFGQKPRVQKADYQPAAKAVLTQRWRPRFRTARSRRSGPAYRSRTRREQAPRFRPLQLRRFSQRIKAPDRGLPGQPRGPGCPCRSTIFNGPRRRWRSVGRSSPEEPAFLPRSLDFLFLLVTCSPFPFLHPPLLIAASDLLPPVLTMVSNRTQTVALI